VALVEDDQLLGEVMVSVFGHHGILVNHFVGVKQLKGEDSYDGFVLDWSIGGETTDDFIQQVLADGRRRPIVMVTGANAYSDRKFAALKESGSVTCFEKPVRLGLVVEALRTAWVALEGR
jgi:DNA-binding response OmpR family regulator